MNVPAVTETDTTKIARAVRDLAEGRSNATGTFALATGAATSTTVTAPNCGDGTFPIIGAKNAAGAAELATGQCFVVSVARRSFVVQHTASAATREFRYALQG